MLPNIKVAPLVYFVTAQVKDRSGRRQLGKLAFEKLINKIAPDGVP